MNDMTRLLAAVDQGDPHAAEQLLPLVYGELRKLAAVKLAQEQPGQTLQATALVHEAYLRLVGPGVRSQGSGVSESAGSANLTPDSCPPTPGFNSRGHFFGAAAEAMRRILVDNARSKQARKRGGEMARQDLDALQLATPEIPEDVLALDEALQRLETADPRAAKLVQLRYFGGMPLPEVAEFMGISQRTADRLWAYARPGCIRKYEGNQRSTTIREFRGVIGGGISHCW
jgi:RNA polymerase sigma factor (sigma-70 family)